LLPAPPGSAIVQPSRLK